MKAVFLALVTLTATSSICNAEPVYLHCAQTGGKVFDEITVDEQLGTVSIDGGATGQIVGLGAVFRPTYVRFQIGSSYRRIDRVSLAYSAGDGVPAAAGRCTILKPPPRRF